jgi:prophage regulatory protein
MAGKTLESTKKKRRKSAADHHAELISAVGDYAVDERPRPRLTLYEDLRPLGIFFSRRHLDRLEAAGKFPRRVALGTNKVAWVTDEIIGHINAQIAARSQDAVGSSGRRRKTAA